MFSPLRFGPLFDTDRFAELLDADLLDDAVEVGE